jgi:hypothetical protein
MCNGSFAAQAKHCKQQERSLKANIDMTTI